MRIFKHHHLIAMLFPRKPEAMEVKHIYCCSDMANIINDVEFTAIEDHQEECENMDEEDEDHKGEEDYDSSVETNMPETYIDK